MLHHVMISRDNSERLLVVAADVGAYMHWYEQYGFHREDIDDCLESCREIVQAYEQAVAPPAPSVMSQQQQVGTMERLQFAASRR